MKKTVEEAGKEWWRSKRLKKDEEDKGWRMKIKVKKKVEDAGEERR